MAKPAKQRAPKLKGGLSQDDIARIIQRDLPNRMLYSSDVQHDAVPPARADSVAPELGAHRNLDAPTGNPHGKRPAKNNSTPDLIVPTGPRAGSNSRDLVNQVKRVIISQKSKKIIGHQG